MTEPAENGERLAAFGRWLARERELRGLGRAEVTKAMKLAPGVVEALESGEEGRMPPRAYAVGYLRAYAAAVGLDPDDAVLRLEEAIGPARGVGPGTPGAKASSRLAAKVPGKPAAKAPGGATRARGTAAGGHRVRAAALAVALAAALAAGAWALLQ